MGYKLAGFDVIGMNEVDLKMAECYIKNLNPKYPFVEPIQEFKQRNLPDTFYDLDILDGSPPCSSFSQAGKREKGWGEKKRFKEGQIKQVLDTLFFDFVDVVEKLKPKVVVAENVPGILMGNAMDYVWRIYRNLEKAGYCVQHFLLDASKMGVPQKRRRVFFIAVRKELIRFLPAQNSLFHMKPKLILRWDGPKLKFGQIRSERGSKKGLSANLNVLLSYRVTTDMHLSDINKRVYGKDTGFTVAIAKDHLICPTIVASGYKFIRDYDNILMSRKDYITVSTFPQDFKFCKIRPQYACGMSVPPVMMAQIARRIDRQWLSRLR